MALEVTVQNRERGKKDASRWSLLKSDALYEYILKTSVYPREPESLKEIREIANTHPWYYMTIGAEQGQFLTMILKLINAKNTMEIGVFVGFSLLATALTIPDDGKILAMDINRKNYDLGLPVIEKAGVAHKIDFREGPALPLLDQLVADEKNHGAFDFVFVDADKDNYLNYHKRLLELVKVGGLIAYDNTLWLGTVAAPLETPLALEGASVNMSGMPREQQIRHYIPYVKELNKALAADPRIEICQLPIGDGLTLCRRIQ